MDDQLVLRPPRPEDEVAARRAHDLLAEEGFELLLGLDPAEPWDRWVERTEAQASGGQLEPDRVPATFLLAFDGGDLVGRVSVRHELNDFLRRLGGHVGYAVVPAHRRRGHGHRLLAHGLAVTRSLGIERALVTCSEGNVASARIIEAAGGALEDVVDGPGPGERTRRYWIATPA